MDSIYSDVEKPFPIHGRQGQGYVVTFLNDHSRLGKCYNVRTKDVILQSFITNSSWAENQMNIRSSKFDEEGLRKTIRVLRDNKGGNTPGIFSTSFSRNTVSIESIRFEAHQSRLISPNASIVTFYRAFLRCSPNPNSLTPYGQRRLRLSFMSTIE
jgi:hypothetical protein